MVKCIQTAGSDLGGKFIVWFTKDTSEEYLGNKLGWLAGSILFQIALDYISGGTWLAAYPVITAIARFLNWPMEALGYVFKLIAKVGKYLVEGIKGLGSMIKEAAAGALKAVSEAIGRIGEKLVQYADEILAKFAGGATKEAASLAERETASLAGKETAKITEKEGQKLTEKELAEQAEKETAQKAEKESAEKAAKEAAERPEAEAAAETVEVTADVAGRSVWEAIAAMELTVMPRFHWIKGFTEEPEGEGYRIFMLASKIPLLHYSGKGKAKPGKSEPTEKPGPSGKKWNDPSLTEKEFLKDYKARYPDTALTDKELKEAFKDGKRLNPETGRLRDPNMPLEPTGPRPDLPTEGKAFDNWQKSKWGDTSTVPCFPPGTIVKTPQGDRVITDLRIGETVFSYDLAARAVVESRVTMIHKNWTDELVMIKTDQGELQATGNHPFWAEDQKRWVAAIELNLGMQLICMPGNGSLIRKVEVQDVLTDTYNLEIAGQHTYFVGSEGILVHNTNVTATASALESSFASIDTYATAIYRVTDPATGKVLYVGQTVLQNGTQAGVEKRLLQHVDDEASALFVKWDSPLRKASDFPANLYRTTRVTGGNWTAYEAAVWEQYHIDLNGGKGALKNEINAITREKYDLYKNLHNPCR
jgi:hypothetical protein